MVWGLFPVDSLTDEENYYIFAPGKYTVGRKGCDINFNKDKGVSRLHAEIVVDAMVFLDPKPNLKSSEVSCNVWIHDCSKYGTRVSKNLGSKKEKVHELPNKEASLDDGDLVSFGTGNASYRFSFVPLVFCIFCPKPFGKDHPLQCNVAAIGAQISPNLTECTHVLVDALMPVNEPIVDAVLAKKDIVLTSWVELVAGNKVRNEIPSFGTYLPTLTVDGISVKLVDPKTRENCLTGYTFLLEETNRYKFGDRLQLLLQLVGAKSFSIEDFYSDSQDFTSGEKDCIIGLIPGGAVEKSSKFCHKLESYTMLNEVDLICAVLSGKLDPSKLTPPCVVVSPSCSSDETMVAESDLEADIANEECSSKPKVTSVPVSTKTEDCLVIKNCRDNDGIKVSIEKSDEPESANTDIIYSQDLIVRHLVKPSTPFRAENNDDVVNFKRFRKGNTLSGNSFCSLIPFSKYPYKSDYGSEEMAESYREEKRQKQNEAVAEDLFNNEKGRRRGLGGSIQQLFSRA